MGRRVDQTGMTLVEVMVAAVILALVLVGVLVSAGHTQRSTLRLQQISQTSWIANNISAELRAGLHGSLSSTGSFQGTQHMGNKSWYWSAQAHPVSDEVIELKIKVHEHEAQPALMTLATAVWRP